MFFVRQAKGGQGSVLSLLEGRLSATSADLSSPAHDQLMSEADAVALCGWGTPPLLRAVQS